MAFFVMDGHAYKLQIKSIQRGARVEEGDNRTTVKTGRYVRDILGTRYNYTLEIDSRISNPAEYDAFYEAITDPARESHTVTVPYGQGTMSFEAYVDEVEDALLGPEKPRRWGGLKILFTAIEPQRKP